MLHECRFRERMDQVEPDIQAVIDACHELKKSVKLKELFEIILAYGNYCNGGKAAGGAFGFTIESLAKLLDTKCITEGHTLGPESNSVLHYIITQLQTKWEGVMEWPSELSTLEEAKKVSIEICRSEVVQLSTGMGKLKAEIKHYTESPLAIGGRQFLECVKDEFCDIYEEDPIKLMKLLKEMETTFTETVKYLAYPEKGATPDTFFGILYEFKEKFCEAIQSIEDFKAKSDAPKKAAKRKQPPVAKPVDKPPPPQIQLVPDDDLKFIEIVCSKDSAGSETEEDKPLPFAAKLRAKGSTIRAESEKLKYTNRLSAHKLGGKSKLSRKETGDEAVRGLKNYNRHTLAKKKILAVTEEGRQKQEKGEHGYDDETYSGALDDLLDLAKKADFSAIRDAQNTDEACYDDLSGEAQKKSSTSLNLDKPERPPHWRTIVHGSRGGSTNSVSTGLLGRQATMKRTCDLNRKVRALQPGTIPNSISPTGPLRSSRLSHTALATSRPQSMCSSVDFTSTPQPVLVNKTNTTNQISLGTDMLERVPSPAHRRTKPPQQERVACESEGMYTRVHSDSVSNVPPKPSKEDSVEAHNSHEMRGLGCGGWNGQRTTAHSREGDKGTTNECESTDEEAGRRGGHKKKEKGLKGKGKDKSKSRSRSLMSLSASLESLKSSTETLFSKKDSSRSKKGDGVSDAEGYTTGSMTVSESDDNISEANGMDVDGDISSVKHTHKKRSLFHMNRRKGRHADTTDRISEEHSLESATTDGSSAGGLEDSRHDGTDVKPSAVNSGNRSSAKDAHTPKARPGDGRETHSQHTTQHNNTNPTDQHHSTDGFHQSHNPHLKAARPTYDTANASTSSQALTSRLTPSCPSDQSDSDTNRPMVALKPACRPESTVSVGANANADESNGVSGSARQGLSIDEQLAMKKQESARQIDQDTNDATIHSAPRPQYTSTRPRPPTAIRTELHVYPRPAPTAGGCGAEEEGSSTPKRNRKGRSKGEKKGRRKDKEKDKEKGKDKESKAKLKGGIRSFSASLEKLRTSTTNLLAKKKETDNAQGSDRHRKRGTRSGDKAHVRYNSSAEGLASADETDFSPDYFNSTAAVPLTSSDDCLETHSKRKRKTHKHTHHAAGAEPSENNQNRSGKDTDTDTGDEEDRQSYRRSLSSSMNSLRSSTESLFSSAGSLLNLKVKDKRESREHKSQLVDMSEEEAQKLEHVLRGIGSGDRANKPVSTYTPSFAAMAHVPGSTRSQADSGDENGQSRSDTEGEDPNVVLLKQRLRSTPQSRTIYADGESDTTTNSSVQPVTHTPAVANSTTRTDTPSHSREARPARPASRPKKDPSSMRGDSLSSINNQSTTSIIQGPPARPPPLTEDARKSATDLIKKPHNGLERTERCPRRHNIAPLICDGDMHVSDTKELKIKSNKKDYQGT
ncbi:hypothetical protein SARC_02794 [Sphaeroforma arctica JP610]|uniref:FH2 domain-containing protein n=1 Tax=Sphaeroforma arctica JP610 TaxID=667725 RepID=A0A0L0G7M9_9EUKA|nr:hypothetical protein SARC_02794 [Sphaeroforma arctica JP610]KNC85005.1 hypothetical protein SARC_02794 [Sphaeroforma arctica JP610]|eukprot:XP_014158907.1 hypothetical protein SARC_02794 [Sphaeroforma arctica JP610]